MGRYGLLLLVTVSSVAVQGVIQPGGVQQVIVTALAGGTLVLAFYTARLKPWLVRAAMAFAAVALLVAIVRAAAGGIGEGAARAVNAALVALGPPAVAIGLLRELRDTQQLLDLSLMSAPVLSAGYLGEPAGRRATGATPRCGPFTPAT